MRVFSGVIALFAVASCASPHGEIDRAPVSTEVLPFIEDDYPHALSEAKARKLPLFVDGWAPW
jgi:hypothetical protein